MTKAWCLVGLCLQGLSDVLWRLVFSSYKGYLNWLPAHLVPRSSSAIIDDHPTMSAQDVIDAPGRDHPRVRERLASYHRRSDVLDAVHGVRPTAEWA